MWEEGGAPALVVIGDEEGEWVREALRAGVVRALLPRAASGGEIIAAVEAVSAGLFALGAETLAALLSPPPQPLMSPPPRRLPKRGQRRP